MKNGENSPGYWVVLAGKTSGPVDQEELRRRLHDGQIMPDELVCPVGDQEWCAIRTLPEFTDLTGQQPTVPPPPASIALSHTVQSDVANDRPAKHASALQNPVSPMSTGEPASTPTQPRKINFACPNCTNRIVVVAKFVGRRARCNNCGTVLTVPSPHGAEGNVVERRVAASAPSVPAQPAAAPRPGADWSSVQEPGQQFGAYDRLPWYRKNPYMSALTIASILGGCIGLGWLPCLVVCVSLISGDVYYNQRLIDGSLRRWHSANRVAAFVLLGLNVAMLVYFLRGVASAL